MTEVLELNLNNLLYNFINDPENSDNNFKLAIYYDSIGQTASAVSYYLRTAERTKFDDIKYQSILRSAICFSIQGSRNFTVKGLLQHALAILPKRPEAYFLLSRFYEKEGSYHDAYLIASLGEKIADKDLEPLNLYVEYPGFYGIIFEKAVSSWWCGLCDESRKLFEDLNKNYDLDEIHKQSVKDNLKMLSEKKKDLHEVYKSKEMREFDWGHASENEWFKNTVEKEIFVDNVYQKFFEVENGDIVFDIGASAGPFTYSIKQKNPTKVYCFEPHSELFKNLTKNVESDTVVCINKSIGPTDGNFETSGLFNKDLAETNADINLKNIPSIKFSTFIEENNIERIDFLKSDCEGGEYDIFNAENLSWIKKNVRKIAGEWHLSTPEQKEKFRNFRDTYLSEFPNHEVYSIDYVDIKWSVWDDWFIEHYSLINLYIDNRNPQPSKKWKNSVLPTMEFTTSIDTKNGCVVDCVFCPQRTLQKSYKGERFLSLENFQKAVDKIPEEIRVTFAGFTEPWLNPKTTEMLLYANEMGHPISVFTTGVGMSVTDVERIKDIAYAGNPNGGFVLHLPDQERKAKHPITDRYIKVIEKFGEVHKDIQNFTLMCMGTVHESVRHIFPEASTYQMWSRAGNLLGESIMKPELLNRKDEYKSVYHGEQPMTCGCLEKLYHNIMLPNGDVSLCCMDYGLEHILGNLLEEDYEDIIPYNNTCFNLCKFCENAKNPL
jgi:FkbM family methyltransferase